MGNAKLLYEQEGIYYELLWQNTSSTSTDRVGLRSVEKKKVSGGTSRVINGCLFYCYHCYFGDYNGEEDSLIWPDKVVMWFSGKYKWTCTWKPVTTQPDEIAKMF